MFPRDTGGINKSRPIVSPAYCRHSSEPVLIQCLGAAAACSKYFDSSCCVTWLSHRLHMDRIDSTTRLSLLQQPIEGSLVFWSINLRIGYLCVLHVEETQ